MLSSSSSGTSKRCRFLSTNAAPTTIAITIKATVPLDIISLCVTTFWLVVVVRFGIWVELIVGAGFGVGLAVGFAVG